MSKNSQKPQKSTMQKVIIIPDGPCIVQGSIPLFQEVIESSELGIALRWRIVHRYPEKKTYSLCRCGKSGKLPYCDGTHSKIGFKSEDISCRCHPLNTAEKYDGPTLFLYDIQELCANARFCDRAGGTWNLTHHSDNPKLREIAIQETCDCPSGRLVMYDKTKEHFVEPPFEKSISLVDDPASEASGPIWIKGRIPIESQDGTPYETRNRVTLCRCSFSDNKPFCNGSHIQKQPDKNGIKNE